MKEEVIKAIMVIATVPLGAENDKEYEEMKGIVLSSLLTITDAAGFKAESEEAFNRMLERVLSPEFKEFLKKAS